MGKWSLFPDRKVWAGGVSAVIAWAIILVATRYGVDFDAVGALFNMTGMAFKAALPIVIGNAIAYFVPATARDVITKLDNRLVAMAQADPTIPVTVPVVTQAEAVPVVVGKQDPGQGVKPPNPAGVTLKAHLWPLAILLPLIGALVGCSAQLERLDAGVKKYAPIAGKNLARIADIVVQIECSPLNGAVTASARALSLKAPNRSDVSKAADALSANLTVAEQLCPLVAAIQTSVGAIPVGQPSVVVPVATGG